ncbi:MAG: HYR domain-containing protein [Candidatus Kapaibacterium sp.]
MNSNIVFHQVPSLRIAFALVIIITSVFVRTVDVFGQTNPTPQALPYSQNFSSGFAHNTATYPAGWQGWDIANSFPSAFSTTSPVANFNLRITGSASSTIGGVHNYNGKIGFMAADTSEDPSLCLALNTTGSSGVTLTFSVMTIRNPYDGSSNTRINQVDIQYRVGTSGAFTSITGASGGIYENNTTTQIGSGVTTPQNNQNVCLVLPSACDNQAVVQLRWVQRDVSGTGGRPSFAIDNVSLCSGTVCSQGNDECCGAISLTVGSSCSPSTYSNVGASASSTVANPSCGFYQGGDVWFSAVVPTSGNMRIEVNGVSGINAQWAMYTGSCSSLTQYSCNQSDAANTVSDASLSGQTVYIRVWNFNSASGGVFNICVWEPSIPTHNNCANASMLTVGSSCSMSSFTNAYATAEATSVSPNPSCGFYAGGDVWHTCVMPASGKLRIERTNGTANAQITLYQGTCGSMTELMCMQLDGDRTYYNPSLAGQTLYIRVYNFNNEDGGTYDICVWEPPMPSHNFCANAAPLTVGASCSMSSFSNAYATAEATSVSPNPSCGFYAGGDVWHTFVMPASGKLRIERTNGTANAQIAVYQGTCGSMSEVLCMQLDADRTYFNPSLAGQTLYLRVYNYNNEEGGTYSICLWEPTMPAHDLCANAIPLTVGSTCSMSSFTNAYALAEATSVSPNPTCGFYAGGDVWHTFVMPTSGKLRVERTNGTANAQIAVYQGTCGSMSQLFCMQLDGDRTYYNPSLAGQTLYMRVYNYNNEEGGTYSVCVWEPPIPVNDNCANAIPVTVGGTCSMISSTNAYATSESTSIAPNPSCGFYSGGDIWYKLIMPTTGNLKIDRTNSAGANAQWAMYTGTCGSFSQIVCAQLTSSTTLANASLAGQTLYLRFFSYSSEEGGAFTFCAYDPTCTAPTFTTCSSTINDNTGSSGGCSKVETYTVSATGSPTPTYSYSFSGATTGSGTGTGSGSTFNVGTTAVAVSATNSCGTTTCTFNVVLNDTQNPTITCPGNQSYNTVPGDCHAVLLSLGNPITSDNCGIASIVTNHPSTIYPLGTTTVLWTVTDVNGNTATCNQTITITDTHLPTIICPDDINVNVDAGTCNATGVSLGTPTTSDNCGVATIVNNHPSTTYPVGTTTVVWTVTDVNGNSSTCNQVVTVTDNIAPSITCPTNITVNNTTGLCGAIVSPLGTPTTSDNCGVQSVTNNHIFSTYPLGTTTVIWTVTDVNGNTSTCNQTVTVVDAQNPTITCPSNISVYAAIGSCSAEVSTLGTPTTSDNCGVASVVNNHSSTSYPVGTTTVVWTVTDVNGNTATCNQAVTVTDNQNPTITCPSDITINADAGQCGAVVSTLGTPTTSDNCGVASVVNNHPSTSYPVGTTTVVWTVTDVNGNTATCNQTVTVTDNQNPTITCPSDITINADAGQCGAVVSTLGTPTTSDNCGVASVVNNHSSTSYPVGTTTVVWTVTDVNGNTATCNQTVTVTDNQNPTITCPSDITINADAGQCGAVVSTLGTPTTSDNCGVASVVNNHSSTSYPVGITTVVWTVTDVNGNTATCNQTVTVTDNQNPTITCPSNISVNAATGSCSATVSTLGTPTTSDNCGVASVTNNYSSSVYLVGVTTVVWTVTDVNGNTATCNQTVTVTDNQNPTITCPTNISVNAATGSCSATVSMLGTPTTSDNCGVASVTNNHSSASYPVGTTTVLWTVTDMHGNTAICNQTVTVTDNQNPTITCPSNITATATSSAGAVVNYTTPIGTDNCSGATTVRTAGYASGSTFPIGTTTVTHTATDASGNISSCSFTVTVVTTGTAPTVTCPGTITVNNTTGSCSANVTYTVSATGTPTPTITYSKASGSSFNVGTTAVTVTATNSSGTASCTFNVVVHDNQQPSITAPSNIEFCFGQYNNGCSVSLGTPSTSDNCGVASVTNNAPSCFNVGTTTVTWTVTDTHGNTKTAIQTVRRNAKLKLKVCATPARRIVRGTYQNVGPLGPQSIPLTTTVTGGTPGYSYSWSPSTGLSSTTAANPSASPNTTTTYTVTVTDSKGCTISKSITIVVVQLSSIVCQTGNNWKVKVCHHPSNDDDEDDDGQQLCVSYNALSAHINNGNGHSGCYLGECMEHRCSGGNDDDDDDDGDDDDDDNDKAVAQDEINNISTDHAFVQYHPNPANSVALFKVMVPEAGRCKLEILDARGITISEMFDGMIQCNQELNIEFDVSMLPDGLYFYRLTSANETITGKLIVLH